MPEQRLKRTREAYRDEFAAQPVCHAWPNCHCSGCWAVDMPAESARLRMKLADLIDTLCESVDWPERRS